ncbi:MAG: serine/threonine-protein kinase [Thermogemmata sp.]|nr:serine/threonine-protein kinase [Thermogemmata sp.]
MAGGTPMHSGKISEALPAGECLEAGELERLIRGRLSSSRAALAVEHLSQCPRCQNRLEQLAAGSETLTAALRELASNQPPRHSAFHRALQAIEYELGMTTVVPEKRSDMPSDDLRFLTPCDEPGCLGRLGPFRIRRVLGRGGMGVVFQAYDPDLDREVAIKIIEPHLVGNEIARQRFCREARAAAAVTHDHIVTVHQVAEDEASGLPYLVMQLIQGESLEQRLRREGKLNALMVARIGMQAAAGLAAAHAAGLIHRDVKPANILLEAPHDRVKLTDFGLARAVEDVQLTSSGVVAGSPLYMSPEQARGEAIDFRTDLFSLGTVLYEAASGHSPFAAPTPLSVLRRITDEEVPPLHQLDPTIPRELSDIISKLMAKRPEQRYASAKAVAEALAQQLARQQQLHPLEVPVGLNVDSRWFSLSGTSPAWKILLQQGWYSCQRLGRSLRWTVPWLGGAAIGAGLVAIILQPSHVVEHVVEQIVEVPQPRTSGPAPDLILDGRAGGVWSLAFAAPDRLVAGAEDGSLRLWDLRRAAEAGEGLLKTFEPLQNGNIWSIDVSPKGKYMVSACDDAAVVLWNLHTLRFEGLKFPHPHSARSAAFSPNGRYLATGDRNSTVRLWDLDTQVPIELLGHRGTILALAFSPDGRFLASAASEGHILLWDLQEEALWRRQHLEHYLRLAEHRGPVYGLAFAPDGEHLASCGWDGTLRLWNVNDGTQLWNHKAHEGDAWGVSFGSNGQWVATCGADGAVKVWKVPEGKEIFHWRGERGMHIVRFGPDGRTLAAAGRDGMVRIWRLPATMESEPQPFTSSHEPKDRTR